MMTGSLKKKKIKKKKIKRFFFFLLKKKGGGGPLIRACSLIRSNTVIVFYHLLPEHLQNLFINHEIQQIMKNSNPFQRQIL